jgi:hypothetical protein
MWYGAAGVVVYANTEPGEYEYFINVTWEENELMKAEAKINSGDIDGGLSSVDAVRVDRRRTSGCFEQDLHSIKQGKN